MERLRDTAFGSPGGEDADALLQVDDLQCFPTPGEIVSQIGLVIAVCLGLGLLARVLVAVVGIY